MSPTASKIVLLLLATAIALLVAVIATWLMSSSGTGMPRAVLTGGTAFAGTMTLAILILHQVGPMS